MERWEASIQDYEVLMHEMPGDEEVSKALSDARLQLEKQRDRSNNFITITSKDQFKQFIATSSKHPSGFCRTVESKIFFFGSMHPLIDLKLPQLKCNNILTWRLVLLAGLSVALLFNKSRDVSIQTVSLVEQLSKRYATVNFLKVRLSYFNIYTIQYTFYENIYNCRKIFYLLTKGTDDTSDDKNQCSASAWKLMSVSFYPQNHEPLRVRDKVVTTQKL